MYRTRVKPVHQDTDAQRSIERNNECFKNFYLRTTVNRRTLVGRVERTNEERV